MGIFSLMQDSPWGLIMVGVVCVTLYETESVTVNTPIWVMHSLSLMSSGSYYSFYTATQITDLHSILGTTNKGQNAVH